MPRKTRRRRAARRTGDRFNEAAARCRGKLVGGCQGDGRIGASMRPRPDAAENSNAVFGAVGSGILLQ